MYLAIDIGGSKTLMAALTYSGEVRETFKFHTDQDYSKFLDQIKTAFQDNFSDHRFTAACCAVPGRLDREKGLVITLGNLPWKNKPIKKDISKVIDHTPVLIENDANLAGLAEARVHPKYKKVLYLTVSTGIGDGIIIDGKIDPNFADSEPGQMVVEYEGKLQKWEDFASGRALFAKYNKKASEIEDSATWKDFSKGLARGINELVATLQPEVIILGGGVGAHYEKFSKYLELALRELENPMTPTPPIIKAKHSEEAVIYGCYEYIKQHI